MQELTLQTQSLQTETGVLSPQREAELLGQISALKSQLEETARELANLKKVVYVPARLFVRKHYAETVKCPK